ncbi:hypothetical protein P3X46_030355 [Hevea brasiliensis]|uniref:RNase H type-1 domain-containing protein n=1 Tax=Hevea brasiliensis TaxID=3981 RepID=A0ABQ9KI08_HEVBR|nr:uncharacterized protein LOC131169078 [Hevea brasiliensis]KAJ9139642.1 hypothetical protein P3X46_030355 [Hevea brasiliensis]
MWKGTRLSPTQVVFNESQFLFQWKCASSMPPHVSVPPVLSQAPLVRWCPPLVGLLKCNFNVAFAANHEFMGLGWIMRNLSGVFRAAKMKTVMGTVSFTVAEALCFREALSWLKVRGWTKVQLESDSLLLVQAVSSRLTYRSYFGSIVNDRKWLMRDLQFCSLHFVRKAANQAAHTVARAAISEPGENEWVDEVPSFLEDAVQFDLLS